MRNTARKGTRDLVDILANPDNAGYIGNDLAEYEERMEEDLFESDELEELLAE